MKNKCIKLILSEGINIVSLNINLINFQMVKVFKSEAMLEEVCHWM